MIVFLFSKYWKINFSHINALILLRNARFEYVIQDSISTFFFEYPTTNLRKYLKIIIDSSLFCNYSIIKWSIKINYIKTQKIKVFFRRFVQILNLNSFIMLKSYNNNCWWQRNIPFKLFSFLLIKCFDWKLLIRILIYINDYNIM